MIFPISVGISAFVLYCEKNHQLWSSKKVKKKTFSSCLLSWQCIGLYYLCSNIYFQNQIQNLRFQPFKIALFFPRFWPYSVLLHINYNNIRGGRNWPRGGRGKRKGETAKARRSLGKDERALFSIYFYFFLFFFEASWFGPSPKNLPSSSAFSNSVWGLFFVLFSGELGLDRAGHILPSLTRWQPLGCSENIIYKKTDMKKCCQGKNFFFEYQSILNLKRKWKLLSGVWFVNMWVH